MGVSTVYEEFRADFALFPGVVVPAGRYHFQTLRGTCSPSQGSLLRTSASVEVGHFFDGWRVSADVSPTWNPSPHVEMSGTCQFNHVRFVERGEEFTAQVARLRTRLALDTRLSGAGFVQYNSAMNGVFGNARIRYNPREGNDLHLVFNESLVTDRFGFLPQRPLTEGRTLMVKYVRALTLGFCEAESEPCIQPPGSNTAPAYQDRARPWGPEGRTSGRNGCGRSPCRGRP